MNEFKLQMKKHQSKGEEAEEAADLLFDDDCIERVFFEVLLKLDFKTGTEEDSGDCNITSKMYQCFERFFIYINEQYGQIVLTMHSLQNLSSQTTDIDSEPLQFDVYDD